MRGIIAIYRERIDFFRGIFINIRENITYLRGSLVPLSCDHYKLTRDH